MGGVYENLMNDKYVRCHICEAVNLDRGGEVECRRCGEKIYIDESISLHKTVAFLITAIILYIPANIYPILVTKQFGVIKPEYNYGGELCTYGREGSYPICSNLSLFGSSIWSLF